MTITSTTSTSDGVTATFSIPFPFFSRDHVQVLVGDVAYGGTVTWLSDSSIELDPVPASGVKVTRRRVTPDTPARSTFTTSNISGAGLNANHRQALYLAQENASALGRTTMVPPGEAGLTLADASSRAGTVQEYDDTGSSRTDRTINDIAVAAAEIVGARTIEPILASEAQAAGQADNTAVLSSLRASQLVNARLGEVNVASYISATDGGDISLALVRAAAESLGRTLRFPADGDYEVATVADLGAYSRVNIIADGVRFHVVENVAAIRMSPPVYEAVQACTAAPVDSYWSDRALVTVADATAYTVGRTVKIVSDDIVWGVRASPGDGTDYRRGEKARIVAIDTGSNVLTLDRPLFDIYSTNPRIGMLPERSFQWRGGSIDYEDGHEADWRPTAMVLYGIDRPVVTGLEILRTYSAGVALVDCVDALVDIYGRRLLNNESNQQYGYLLTDNSSQGTNARVVAGENRHAYTTNINPVAADSDDLHTYGPTRSALVTGSVHGDTQAGFDTHHGSEGVVFSNVMVTGAKTGTASIVFRGRGHRALSPTISGGKGGIYVYTEAGATDRTTDVEIVNAQVDCDKYALSIDDADVTIDGGTFRSRYYGNPVQATDATIRFKGDVSLRPGKLTEIDSHRTIELYDSSVDATDAKITCDLQDIPSSAANYGVVQGDGLTASAWVGGTVRTINDTYLTAVQYIKNLSAATWSFAPELILTEKLGSNPASTMSILGDTAYLGTGFVWKHTGRGGGSNFISLTISADGVTPPWYGRGDPDVTMRLFASANRTLGALPAGTFVGQRLHISTTISSNARIILRTGSGTYLAALPGGANIALGAEEGLSFTWSGATWVTSDLARLAPVALSSDADTTLYWTSSADQILKVPITADRAITLPASPGLSGGFAKRFRFARTAAATGAYNWNVNGNSTTLKALTPGTSCEAVWDTTNSVWEVVASGSV